MRRRAGTSRAYSLIELIVVAAMVIIVFYIASPRMATSMRPQSKTRAAAMRLAEDLRYLRQRAISTHAPAALIVPSDNLGKGHCSGYILSEGLSGRNDRNAVDFSRNYSGVSVFVGKWKINPSLLRDSTLVWSASPLLPRTNSQGYDVDNWSGNSKDYIFLFTPSGSLIANGNMPHFDDAYHIVVAEQFSPANSSLPPGSLTGKSLTSCFEIGTVSPPVYTVTITPAGEVSLESGLLAASDGVVVAGASSPGDGASMVSHHSSGSSPVIDSVELYPKVNRTIYPDTAVDTVVRTDGILRIVVKATDADGDQLTLTPSVTSPSSGDLGSFSCSSAVPMVFDPAAGKYCGEVVWKPPPTAAEGSRYTLSFSLGDGSKAAKIDSVIQIAGKGKIAFTSYRDGNPEIYTMYEDGSNVIRLTEVNGEDAHPKWSPDGSKILFVSYRDGIAQVYCMNADGSDQKNISNNLDLWEHGPSWSPTGTRIVFTSREAGKYWICTMNADGSDRIKLTGETAFTWAPSWSPDGSLIAFTSMCDGDYEIYTIKPDGTDRKHLTDNGSYEDGAVWSPDGSKLIFHTSRGGSYEIYEIKADGTDEKNLTQYFELDTWPAWSPDGSKIVFFSWRNDDYEIMTMNADGTNQVNISCSPGNDFYPDWK